MQTCTDKDQFSYLDDGAGYAWAGQVKDIVSSSFIETNPIIAVENFGNVVPIGSVNCDNKER